MHHLHRSRCCIMKNKGHTILQQDTRTVRAQGRTNTVPMSTKLTRKTCLKNRSSLPKELWLQAAHYVLCISFCSSVFALLLHCYQAARPANQWAIIEITMYLKDLHFHQPFLLFWCSSANSNTTWIQFGRKEKCVPNPKLRVKTYFLLQQALPTSLS